MPLQWPPYNRMIPYGHWTKFTPTVPQEYLNVISPQQAIMQLACELHKLICYSDGLADEINSDHEIIQALEDAFDRFIDGEFDQYYRDVIAQWVKDNMPTIIAAAVHMVFFGLTDDGYFCAYIPEEWAFVFDTIMDYSSDDYGKLTIRY